MRKRTFPRALFLLLAALLGEQPTNAQWAQDPATQSISTNFDFNVLNSALMGIGTSSPANAKLSVQGTVGHTIASFRRSASGQGVSIVGDWPGVYFNAYYNEGSKSMAAGYAGIVNFDPSFGRIDLGVTGNPAFSADNPLDITTRMTINSFGNVGIGTSYPNSRLEINGQNALMVNGFEPFATLLDNNSGKANRIQSAHGDLVFSGSDPSIYWPPLYTPKMVLQDDGNLCLGQGRAYAQMAIFNTEFSKPTLNLEAKSPFIAFRQMDENTDIGFIRGWAGAVDMHGFGNNKGLEMGTNPGAGRLIFSTEYRRAMQVETNGNVLIGTEHDPGYKLAVAGKVLCEELKVQLRGNWPDYVFANNYPLPSLDAVEQHIQLEKHLPGIPAAAELEESGLEVGEMQRKMMEKIEELTLYVIALNKENKALKQRVEQLEKR